MELKELFYDMFLLSIHILSEINSQFPFSTIPSL